MTVTSNIKPRFELPTKKIDSSKVWTEQTIMLLGPAGCGKSEFFSPADKALYLQFEPGLSHLSVMRTPITSWEDLGEVYLLLKQAAENNQFPYDTIIFDTGDRFLSRLDEELIRRVKEMFPKERDKIFTLFDYPAASDKGNPVWGMRTELMDKTLEKFRAFPACLVFIGHLDQKEVKTPTAVFQKDAISIGGGLGRNLVHYFDHIMNIKAESGKDKITRTIRTIPSQDVDAKSRGGTIPHGWVLENPPISASKEDRLKAAEVNYKKLRSFFS